MASALLTRAAHNGRMRSLRDRSSTVSCIWPAPTTLPALGTAGSSSYGQMVVGCDSTAAARSISAQACSLNLFGPEAMGPYSNKAPSLVGNLAMPAVASSDYDGVPVLDGSR